MTRISSMAKILFVLAMFFTGAQAQAQDVTSDFKAERSTVQTYTFENLKTGIFYEVLRKSFANSNGLYKPQPRQTVRLDRGLKKYSYFYDSIESQPFEFYVVTQTNNKRQEMIVGYERTKVLFDKEEAAEYWQSLFTLYEQPDDVEGGRYGYGPYIAKTTNHNVSPVSSDWVEFAYWPVAINDTSTMVLQYSQVVGEENVEHHIIERIGTEEYLTGLGFDFTIPLLETVGQKQGFSFSELFKVIGFGFGLLLFLGLIFYAYKKREEKSNSFDDVQPFS